MIGMQGDQTKAESIDSQTSGESTSVASIGSRNASNQPTGAEIHRIRLRRGWEIEHAPDEIERISLPTCFATADQALIRLSRSFQPPPIDPDHERVRIELCDVPGLVSISLNGRTREDFFENRLYLTRPLESRYRFDLTVEARLAATTLEWGSIALVIENAPTPANDAETVAETETDSISTTRSDKITRLILTNESGSFEAEGSSPRGDERTLSLTHDRESLKE